MKWFPRLNNLKVLAESDKKIKIVLLLFLIGILLLCFPWSPKKQTSKETQSHMINQKATNAKDLEKLLSELTGKKVKVLITYQDTGNIEVVSEEKTITQTEDTGGKIQTDKKPLLDSNKNIIIKNREQPNIKGVCIVYFGTYHSDTEKLLCRAAKGALGAELHTIEVIFTPS